MGSSGVGKASCDVFKRRLTEKRLQLGRLGGWVSGGATSRPCGESGPMIFDGRASTLADTQSRA
jgi:hypothetical protein